MTNQLTVIALLALIGVALALPIRPAAVQPPDSADNSCRLILPESMTAVVGHEISIYCDNVTLVVNPRNFVFEVKCAKGINQNERWKFVPKPEDVGDLDLTLNVYDADNRRIATGSTKIRVVPAEAGAGRQATMLIIGDSLTQFAVFPQEILNLCKTPGNPRLELLGTNHISGTSRENRHEGYGGWTFEHFVTFYSEEHDPVNYKTMCSPFVFMEDGNATLDFSRYVAEKCGGKAPDFVCIELGVNDIYRATDSDIEPTLDRIFGFADQLVASIRKAGPNTRIGVGMIPPPAANQDAFGNNDGCSQTRWNYKRCQHRFLERAKQIYGGREASGIYLIPLYINIDTEHNYIIEKVPANSRSSTEIVRQANAVHPADSGYGQMADTIYYWMKGLLQQQ
jgi:lysophospholipase L1-like esterase